MPMRVTLRLELNGGIGRHQKFCLQDGANNVIITVGSIFLYLYLFYRCNGQGIKPGRPALTPKPDMFPCHLCGRKLATREAHEVHISRCDGVNNNTRGRKPADNTCMVSLLFVCARKGIGGT